MGKNKKSNKNVHFDVTRSPTKGKVTKKAKKTISKSSLKGWSSEHVPPPQSTDNGLAPSCDSSFHLYDNVPEKNEIAETHTATGNDGNYSLSEINIDLRQCYKPAK